jgi:hypothetical protein
MVRNFQVYVTHRLSMMCKEASAIRTVTFVYFIRILLLKDWTGDHSGRSIA